MNVRHKKSVTLVISGIIFFLFVCKLESYFFLYGFQMRKRMNRIFLVKSYLGVMPL